VADERFIHDDRFVESFSNVDHTILGKRLDPYCLWHQFNLEIAQSNILLGHPLSPLDLWTAVRICTTPWTIQHRIPNLKTPGKIGFVWAVGRFNFRTEVQKFQDYLDDYVTSPKLWPNNHKQSGGAPDRDFDENLELALYLSKETNLTWREIWTMPLGMLKWSSVGLAKLGGAKIDIWTPEHEEMFVKHVEKREAGIDARAKVIAEAEGITFAAAHRRAFDEHWDKVKIAYGNATKPEYRGR